MEKPNDRIKLDITEQKNSICEECGNNIAYHSHARNCSYKSAFARLIADCAGQNKNYAYDSEL